MARRSSHESGSTDLIVETIDIALASDHRYFCGLLVASVSMARHAARDVALRFNVLDGGLTDEDWRTLHEKLQIEHPRVVVRAFRIDESHFGSFPAWSWGSRMAYARLALPELLADAEFVLYCDVDFLWQADVAELWALRDRRHAIQGHPDGWKLTCLRESAWFARNGIPFDPERYVCTGLLVMNLGMWREQGLERKVMAFLSEHPDVPYAEQTAVNAVVTDVGLLPRKWHRFSREMTRLDVGGECAIHFAGDTPWCCNWRAQPLGEAALAWHRFYGNLTGIGTWRSLRRSFPLQDVVLRRMLGLIVRCRVTRAPFFALLRLLRHGGCIDYYKDRRIW